MLKRLWCLFALAAAVVVLAWSAPQPAHVATSAVLGSTWTLADVISGTYGRSERAGRKAKPQRVAQRPAKKSGKATTQLAQSRASKVKRPPMRELADGYRTLCVRLCDGYYFPVSAAAKPGEFQRDEATCQASCASPAKLFVYRNKDGSPDTMIDLEGLPYGALANAFQYRVSYEASCTCTPAPWTEAAANRHKLYAMNEAAAAGDRAADLARIQLEAAVRVEDHAARARTGADLVVAAAPQMKAITETHRSLVRKVVAERAPAATRKARVVRTAAAQPARVRVLRSAATPPAPRTVRVVQHTRYTRVSDSRAVIIVSR